MKLILIYGPPAAGKLTVATELAAMTGYKLVDNHKATDFLEEVFPRSDIGLHPWRSKLGRKIRIDLIGAAAEADVNLISPLRHYQPVCLILYATLYKL